jgi:hypothetical protein
MNRIKTDTTVTAYRLERDHNLTADIVPEAYFRCQAVRELNFPFSAHVFDRQFTEVRLAWTDKFFYVHLWAKDSWVVKEDRLELILMPNADHYWGWEVNALGTLLEYTVEGWGEGPVEKRHMVYHKKTGVPFKTKKHDAGWVGEFKIPFAKDLRPLPRTGDTWRITFNRYDSDRQGRLTLSTFSNLGHEPIWFHQPAGFGQIVFG